MKKRLKRTLSVILTLMMIFTAFPVAGLVSSAEDTTEVVHVTSIGIVDAVVDLDGSATLSVHFFPENTTEKNVKWESGNTDIVTVDSNGCIYGVKVGKATVTVTSKDVPTVKGICTVTVCDHPSCNHVKTLPKCEVVGEEYDVCTVCGKKLSYKSQPALGHDPYTSVPMQSPTCTVEGNTAEIKCKTCGIILEKKESIPALGHNYGTKWQADGRGSHFVTCANGCGIKKFVACTYSNGTVVAPTCTDEGYTLYVCSVCGGEFESNKIAALGHDTEWVINQEASYSSSGLRTLVCKRCSAITKTEVIPQWEYVSRVSLEDTIVDYNGTASIKVTFTPEEPHNTGLIWSSSDESIAKVDPNTGVVTGVSAGTAIIRATSKDVGGYYGECVVLVCRHGSTLHKEVAATCTKDGESYDECVYCDKKLNLVIIPKLAHDLYISLPGKDATCTKDGYTTEYSCKACDFIEESVKIPAGHTWSKWTYEGNEKHTHTCSACKFEETVVCVYNITHLTPTCTENGGDVKVCKDCGNKIVNNEVSALGHIDENDDKKCDRCGEKIVDPSETCDCLCHKTGIMRLLYVIVLLFWRLMGVNKTCVCGATHY